MSNIEGGWSLYIDTGTKNHKLHYFPKSDGRSICGHAVLTTRKIKNKFFDPNSFKNPDKICKACLKKLEMMQTV